MIVTVAFAKVAVIAVVVATVVGVAVLIRLGVRVARRPVIMFAGHSTELAMHGLRAPCAI